MDIFIYIVTQLFLWIVLGGFYVVVLVLPIVLAIAIFEFIMGLTVNNLLMLIHKIPLIGPVISGLVASGIGIILFAVGFVVWINYLFIALRCIGGPKA